MHSTLAQGTKSYYRPQDAVGDLSRYWGRGDTVGVQTELARLGFDPTGPLTHRALVDLARQVSAMEDEYARLGQRLDAFCRLPPVCNGRGVGNSPLARDTAREHWATEERRRRDSKLCSRAFSRPSRAVAAPSRLFCPLPLPPSCFSPARISFSSSYSLCVLRPLSRISSWHVPSSSDYART